MQTLVATAILFALGAAGLFGWAELEVAHARKLYGRNIDSGVFQYLITLLYCLPNAVLFALAAVVTQRRWRIRLVPPSRRRPLDFLPQSQTSLRNGTGAQLPRAIMSDISRACARVQELVPSTARLRQATLNRRFTTLWGVGLNVLSRCQRSAPLTMLGRTTQPAGT
jgi:hypothetical protein